MSCAVGRKAGLIAGEVVGLRGVVQARRQRAVIGGQGGLGAGARLFDLLGLRRPKRGPRRAPEAGRARLAIGRLEDAGPQLRRDQHRAVEDVEFKRAGGNVD